MLTTPPPMLDVVKDFPELAPFARTTVRLHPRRARDGAVDASKMGGEFLWPADEPWPAYDEMRVDRFVQQLLGEGGTPGARRIPEGMSIPFAPILQLRAEGFPEMPFPPGADLFQLLWFPYQLEIPEGQKCPDSSLDFRVYWRDAASIAAPRASNPRMVKNSHQGYFAPPCILHPERVVENPNSQDLDPKLERRIDRWKAVKGVEHGGGASSKSSPPANERSTTMLSSNAPRDRVLRQDELSTRPPRSPRRRRRSPGRARRCC